jgi:hypothetical protein
VSADKLSSYFTRIRRGARRGWVVSDGCQWRFRTGSQSCAGAGLTSMARTSREFERSMPAQVAERALTFLGARRRRAGCRSVRDQFHSRRCAQRQIRNRCVCCRARTVCLGTGTDGTGMFWMRRPRIMTQH